MFQKNFMFRGKHATYVKDLVETAGILERNLDVLIIAPIIGLLHDERSTLDKSNSDTTNILTEQLLQEKDLLDFIYKLIILLDTSKELTIEEKIYRAFRIDEEASNLRKKDKQILLENRQLFESYLLGGIEYLYKELYGDGTYDRDKLMNRLYEFIKEFHEDLQIKDHKLQDVIDKSIIK